MEKKIITISREYGSGGRQIGLVAAKKLGMEFYDKELIDAAAKEIGFPAEIIADRATPDKQPASLFRVGNFVLTFLSEGAEAQ